MESDAFRRVLSGETTVVLGNRGAGKSAIFQMLARRSRAKGARVIELAPEDYSYEMLRRTMHSEEQGSWRSTGPTLQRGSHAARPDDERALKRHVRSPGACSSELTIGSPSRTAEPG